MAEFNKDYERQMVEASKAFSRNMKKYPIDLQVAVTTVLPNLLDGCFWGYSDQANKFLVDNIEAVNNGKYGRVYPIKGKNGNPRQNYILIADMKSIIKVLEKEATGLYRVEDLQKALKKHDEAVKRLFKFMKSGSYGIIGIFSTNDSPNIVANAVRYPAFDVTLGELMQLAIMHDYKIVVDGYKYYAKDINMVEMYKELKLAPSGNALFIELAL